MAERKKFFKQRTISQIKELKRKKAYTARDLVKKISDLNPSEESMEIRFNLVPGRFHRHTQNASEASRKAYKHGEYLALSQPTTLKEALDDQKNPRDIRIMDFKSLKDLKEEEINLLGFSFRPVHGRDREKRLVPFPWIIDGARIFAYSENNPRAEIKVNNKYTDAKRIEREGATIIVEVPSREVKKPRYTIRVNHVPIFDNNWKRAIVWSLDTDYVGKNNLEHKTFSIRYKSTNETEGSDVKTFYPQDIAAYLAIAKDFWIKENPVPWITNPFPKPSRTLIDLDNKICNNLLIYDSSLGLRDKLRKPHIAERAIIIGRTIRSLGSKNPAFDPEKSERLKDYEW